MKIILIAFVFIMASCQKELSYVKTTPDVCVIIANKGVDGATGQRLYYYLEHFTGGYQQNYVLVKDTVTLFTYLNTNIGDKWCH